MLLRVVAVVALSGALAVTGYAISEHWGPWRWAHWIMSNRWGDYPPVKTGAATLAIVLTLTVAPFALLALWADRKKR